MPGPPSPTPPPADATAPAVSIIVPVFEAPPEFTHTLDSVLAGQDGLDLEILIVDDGSEHPPEALLRERFGAPRTRGGEQIFATPRGPLRYRHQHNQGAYRTRLTSARRARGDYVKFLDQDDLLLPGALGEELSAARRTGADVVLSDWQVCRYRDGRPVPQTRRHHRAPDYDDPIDGLLELGGSYTSANLIRRRLLETLEPVTRWRPRMSDDWAMSWQVALAGARYTTVHVDAYVWCQHEHRTSADPDGRHHTDETYELLTWVEDTLRSRDALTPRRCRALARYYYRDAVLLCALSPPRWQAIAARIRALQPDFVASPRPRLLRALNLLGDFERAVSRYVALKRRLGREPVGGPRG